jgi:hypothetical protein
MSRLPTGVSRLSYAGGSESRLLYAQGAWAECHETPSIEPPWDVVT